MPGEIRNGTKTNSRICSSAIPCHLSYSVRWFGRGFWMSPLPSLDEDPAWEAMHSFSKLRWWAIISKSTILNWQTQIIELPSKWSLTVKGFGFLYMRSNCDFKVPPNKHINSHFQPCSEETEVWSGFKAACKSVPSTLLPFCLWKNPSRDEWQPHMLLPLTKCTAFCSMLPAPPPLPKNPPSNTNDKSMTNPAWKSSYPPNV